MKTLLAILTALQIFTTTNFEVEIEKSSEVEITDDLSDVFMVVEEYRTIEGNHYLCSDEIAAFTDLEECIEKAKDLNQNAVEVWIDENGEKVYSSFIIMYIMNSGEYCDILFIEKENLGWE